MKNVFLDEVGNLPVSNYSLFCLLKSGNSIRERRRQSMVKGERSNQRKEIKSPPGKLTYNRYKLQSDGGQNENSLNSQRCLLSAGPAR